MATKEENYLDLEDKFNDRWWRLNNLYYIKDKFGQKILFKPNAAQEKLYNNLHFLNLILKARQLGFTTLIQILMIDVAIFNSNIRCGVIAQTREDASDFFREKIKFAYDNLPDSIKAKVYPTTDSTTDLALSNGSSIKVGTSLRSGTFQWLHISEFGKICAKFPEKAREIITGALNTIEAGQVVFIESTAEGQEGKFYEMCEIAQAKLKSKAELTPLDFKFFFYPWYDEVKYRLDPKSVVITKEMQGYFGKLKDKYGIELDNWQIAWYVKKEELQGDDMKREFPSTPEEAFEQSVEGAIFPRQFVFLDENQKILPIPHDPSYPVLTAWDIGRHDANAIWFYQNKQGMFDFINYLEGVGMGLPDYIRMLKEHQEVAKGGYVYGKHYAPHDINQTEWGTNQNRWETAYNLGLTFEATPKLPKDEQIDAARAFLPKCRFDSVNCALGVKRLRSYKKEWDDKAGVFKKGPKHDVSSNGADAFQIAALNHTDPTQVNFLQNNLNDGNIDRTELSQGLNGQQSLQGNTGCPRMYED